MTDRRYDYGPAIAALVAGASPDAAARAGNVPLPALKRWLRGPTGVAELAAAEQDVITRTRRAATSGALLAIQTLVAAATNQTGNVAWPQRIAAAKSLAELVYGKRIEVTGAGGGPIEVDLAAGDALRARYERMAERLHVIETTEARPEDDVIFEPALAPTQEIRERLGAVGVAVG